MSAAAKRLAFDRALAHGNVSVMFNPSHASVVIPERLRAQAHVVLEYGYDLAVPIPDLTVSAHGVSATLSFDRRPSLTFVPWEAVFAIDWSDGRREVWGSDVPLSVRESNVAHLHSARGLLHLVKGGKPS